MNKTNTEFARQKSVLEEILVGTFGRIVSLGGQEALENMIISAKKKLRNRTKQQQEQSARTSLM